MKKKIVDQRRERKQKTNVNGANSNKAKINQ